MHELKQFSGSCSETRLAQFGRAMLQVSQIENDMLGTIEPDSNTSAMNLPLEFQNLSSSGFQSEIQVVLRSLSARYPRFECRPCLPGAFPGKKKAASVGALDAHPDSALRMGPSLDLATPNLSRRLDLRIKLRAVRKTLDIKWNHIDGVVRGGVRKGLNSGNRIGAAQHAVFLCAQK